jgi:hypothetical protein
MKNKLFSISLIFIFFVVLATVASAAQMTKIGSGSQPAIDGSKVTWSDTSGRIHIYDVTTKKAPQSARMQRPIQLSPAIS